MMTGSKLIYKKRGRREARGRGKPSSRGGSFSQKIESANLAIKLYGISCELEGCVHRPIVDSESTIAG
jgi:hypothetical protein